MDARIYCTSTSKGIHSFYIVVGGETFYLFSQDYRDGVNSFYRNGVSIDNAWDYSKAHKDAAINRTMDKLPMYVRYVEKEYGLAVLRKTRKKLSKKYMRQFV